MGIEKYVSFGRNAMFGLGLSALVGLTACGTIFEVPKRVAEEVINTTYRLVTLPLTPFLGNNEPAINKCIIINPEEKVCRSYLSETISGGLTLEYLSVLRINKEIPQYQLVLGYFDGNNYDFFDPDKKLLIVVAYNGRSSEDLIDPYYGKLDFPFDEFMDFFERPRANIFDDSDNQFKRLAERNLIDDIEFAIIRGRLKEIMRRALKLADEQLPKPNE